jgi:hypothetical protein
VPTPLHVSRHALTPLIASATHVLPLPQSLLELQPF